MDIAEHNKLLLKIIRDQVWSASSLYQDNFCKCLSDTYTPDPWSEFIQECFTDIALSLSRAIEKLEGVSEEELQKSYSFFDRKIQKQEEELPF
jgi:hypothetical protein